MQDKHFGRRQDDRETGFYVLVEDHDVVVTGCCCWSSCPVGGSTTYAHIDITASETAQRVAAEHAQGREDRLMELEENPPRGARTG